MISPVMLTDLPKFELFFVVESKTEREIVSQSLLAFQVNKIV